jgi:hypothetical protein
MAAARNDAHVLPLDMNCKAVAVPFYLEQPVRACRRLRLQKSEAGFDPLRHRVERQVGLPRIALAQAW